MNKTNVSESSAAKVFFLSTLAVAALAQLNGCYGDVALIDEYIGDQKYLATCRGRCLNEDRIDKEDCSGDYAIWLENSAKNEDKGDGNAMSRQGYCLVQHIDVCTQIGSLEKYRTGDESGKIEWLNLDFQMRDFGNGIYGRFIAKEAYDPQNDPEVRKNMEGYYICGTISQVTDKSLTIEKIAQNNDLPCSEEQTDKLRISFQGRSCPVAANKCSYNTWLTSDLNAHFEQAGIEREYIGICSTCDVGLVSCKGTCVDLYNDPDNCGACGNRCGDDDEDRKNENESENESKRFCNKGQCAKVKECNAPGYFCTGDKSDICVQPLSDVSCGATCDNVSGTKCPADKSCVKNGDAYECQCDSGVYKKRADGTTVCIDPANRETCGATMENPDGDRCVAGETCSGTGDLYACNCPSNITQIKTYKESEDGREIEQRICVDPSSGNYCGATQSNPDGVACTPGTHCEKYADAPGNMTYRCACDANWNLGCYDSTGKLTCLNVVNDVRYCGMTEADCGSLQQTTQVCDINQSCKGGECVCDDGGVLCETGDGTKHCVNAKSHVLYCGAKGLCNSNSPESQNFKGARCSGNEVCSDGVCECKGGTRCADNTCPDPSYVKTCGIGDNCEGGEDCTKSGRVCRHDSNGYHCDCPNDGEVYCGAAEGKVGQCIDPKTNGTYCGAEAPCAAHPGSDCAKEGKVCRFDDSTNQFSCETHCSGDLVKCGNDCVDPNVYHVTQDCKRCHLDYCYTGDAEDLEEGGAFDYKKCRLLDEYGNPVTFTDKDGNVRDANLKNSSYFCNGCFGVRAYKHGLPEGTAVHCPESMYCSGEVSKDYECVCRSGKTECIYKAKDGDGNDIDDSLCLDFEMLHMTDCTTCAAGYDNCDGDWSNGCETDLSDVETCGSCHTNCYTEVANVFGTRCDNYQCNYMGCWENFGDCDETRANGCEMGGLNSSMDHCGRCNSTCNASKCENGTCCWENREDVGVSEKCCNGYKKYYFQSSIKCWGSSEYRCATSKPKYVIGSCWQEVAN